jgi:hypothetical protein
VGVTEFHTFEAYSGLGLASFKYDIDKLPRVENKWVIVCIKPRILTD